jgi:hypothetical protein
MTLKLTLAARFVGHERPYACPNCTRRPSSHNVFRWKNSPFHIYNMYIQSLNSKYAEQM